MQGKKPRTAEQKIKQSKRTKLNKVHKYERLIVKGGMPEQIKVWQEKLNNLVNK